MSNKDTIQAWLAEMAGQSPHAADLTRRRFLAGAAKLGLTATAAMALTRSFAMPAFAADEVALPKITSIPDKLKGTGIVRYCSFGGALQEAQRKAYLKPFEELSGIKVVESEGPDAAKVKAMVDTGNIEWDMYEDDGGSVLNLLKKGDYYEPINYSLFDAENIDTSAKQKFFFNMLPYAQIIAYRKDAFGGKVPKDVKDFWNTEAFRARAPCNRAAAASTPTSNSPPWRPVPPRTSSIPSISTRPSPAWPRSSRASSSGGKPVRCPRNC